MTISTLQADVAQLQRDQDRLNRNSDAAIAKLAGECARLRLQLQLRDDGPCDCERCRRALLADALSALEKIAAVNLDDHEDAFEAYGMRGDIARTALVNFARATGGKS